ncbi:MAG: (Fe-S)-binding protein [Proteobacteria bacterium]|nr:(Fe-S)-binding protein [Pseudomonadota bacterium]
MTEKSNNDCAKCGACTSVCPVYQITGNEAHTARGKLHLISKLPGHSDSEVYAEILSKCLLCGACAKVCTRKINPPLLLAKARNQIPKTSGEHPFLQYLLRKSLSSSNLLAVISAMGVSLDKLTRNLPAASGLRLRLPLAQWKAQPQKNNTQLPHETIAFDEQTSINYFSGCMATYLCPAISVATANLARSIRKKTLVRQEGQNCCGLAAFSAGKLSEAQNLAKKNILAFESNQKPILTSCGSCFKHLKDYPELLADDPDWQGRAKDFADRILEFSAFLLQDNKIGSGDKHEKKTFVSTKIFYHDPCHLRHNDKSTKAPRTLLNSIPGVIIVEMPDGPRCCGHGGLFHLARPRLSKNIRNVFMEDFESLTVDTLTSTCSACLIQLQTSLVETNKSTPVKHLAVLLEELISGS